MVGKRKYDDGCAVAHALDLVGERWALLVVRELLLGPKRFTDLLAGVRGASPDVLTQRLRDLTETGVVRRKRLGPPTSAQVYELTTWGADLGPIVVGLARWASHSPGMRYDAPLGTDSAVLSLEALFDPPAAAGLDATIDTNTNTLLSLLRANRPLDDALANGELRLAGDRALVEKFMCLFPTPLASS